MGGRHLSIYTLVPKRETRKYHRRLPLGAQCLVCGLLKRASFSRTPGITRSAFWW